MIAKSLTGFTFTVILVAFVLFNGCKRDLDVLEPATYPTNAEVFMDQFGPGLQFQAFGDSKLDALQTDFVEKYSGTHSLKITVPSSGNVLGTYAGGAFVSEAGRNLSGYNALTFWAKSSIEATLNVAGLGNDNTGASKFTAQKTNLPLHTIWTKYVIPIPNPQKLTTEKGLFFFAIANVAGAGFNTWFDEIKYETIGTLAYPRLTIGTKTVEKMVGDTLHIDNPVITFNLNGVDQKVEATPSYLTYNSTDNAVANVSADGIVTAMGAGTAIITAKLGSVDAAGAITINSKPSANPLVAAPTPTITADKVISIFSNSYTNISVDTWAASWSNATYSDTSVAGDNVKLYKNLGFAGIVFASPTINAGTMTHFHMDIWTPYPTALPSTFKIKLVDFGADGTAGGGNDTESEVSYTASSTPPLKTGSWVSIDIPLSDFAIASQEHLGQLIISGDLKTVWIDNIYLYKGAGGQTVPTVPAPTPTHPAGNVISLFSDAYSNRPVDNDIWAAYWQYSTSVVTNRVIAGNNVKQYTNLNFAGIEFTGANMIDATAMTHFHIDIWTPNSSTLPSAFKVLLVDFGANGAYGGGDDTQHELTFNATSTPALTTGMWISLDIALSKFTGLINRNHLAQLVLSGAGDIKTLWIDNVYFHN